MEPTLAQGARVTVTRPSAWRPVRGEIVAFAWPCDPGKTFVMRIAAVAGDAIEVRCNVPHINGQAMAQERVAGACRYDEPDDDTPGAGGAATRREVTCHRYHERQGELSYDIVLAGDAPEPGVGGGLDFPRGELPRCAGQGGGGAGDEVAPGVLSAPVDPALAPGPCAVQQRFVVPADTVFVMGDNRDHASDSRAWGVVPVARLQGRVEP